MKNVRRPPQIKKIFANPIFDRDPVYPECMKSC
jgi:hypothetical protein